MWSQHGPDLAQAEVLGLHRAGNRRGRHGRCVSVMPGSARSTSSGHEQLWSRSSPVAGVRRSGRLRRRWSGSRRSSARDPGTALIGDLALHRSTAARCCSGMETQLVGMMVSRWARMWRSSAPKHSSRIVVVERQVARVRFQRERAERPAQPRHFHEQLLRMAALGNTCGAAAPAPS